MKLIFLSLLCFISTDSSIAEKVECKPHFVTGPRRLCKVYDESNCPPNARFIPIECKVISAKVRTRCKEYLCETPFQYPTTTTPLLPKVRSDKFHLEETEADQQISTSTTDATSSVIFSFSTELQSITTEASKTISTTRSKPLVTSATSKLLTTSRHLPLTTAVTSENTSPKSFNNEVDSEIAINYFSFGVITVVIILLVLVVCFLFRCGLCSRNKPRADSPHNNRETGVEVNSNQPRPDLDSNRHRISTSSLFDELSRQMDHLNLEDEQRGHGPVDLRQRPTNNSSPQSQFEPVNVEQYSTPSLTIGSAGRPLYATNSGVLESCRGSETTAARQLVNAESAEYSNITTANYENSSMAHHTTQSGCRNLDETHSRCSPAPSSSFYDRCSDKHVYQNAETTSKSFRTPFLKMSPIKESLTASSGQYENLTLEIQNEPTYELIELRKQEPKNKELEILEDETEDETDSNDREVRKHKADYELHEPETAKLRELETAFEVREFETAHEVCELEKCSGDEDNKSDSSTDKKPTRETEIATQDSSFDEQCPPTRDDLSEGSSEEREFRLSLLIKEESVLKKTLNQRSNNEASLPSFSGSMNVEGAVASDENIQRAVEVTENDTQSAEYRSLRESPTEQFKSFCSTPTGSSRQNSQAENIYQDRQPPYIVNVPRLQHQPEVERQHRNPHQINQPYIAEMWLPGTDLSFPWPSLF